LGLLKLIRGYPDSPITGPTKTAKVPQKVPGPTTLFQVNPTTHTVETLALVKNRAGAERVADCLRNAGVATHQYWVEDHYSFAEQLSKREWDLVVLDMPKGNRHVPACILRYPDTPFVALTETSKTALVDELLELGITDVANLTQPARLKHSLHRALREASLKRDKLALSRQSREQDNLLRSLLNGTDDAIAYVHQGVHCYVNPAYVRLLGLPDSATAIATPLLDLVARKYRPTLARLLRDFHKGQQLEAKLNTYLCRQDGVLISAIARPVNANAKSVTPIRPRGKQNGNARQHNPLKTDRVLEQWSKRMVELLGGSSLGIHVSPVAPAKSGGSVYGNWFQLTPALDAGQNGPQSIEKLLAESRRVGLLRGLDEWLVYNAASALAKKLPTHPDARYFVALQSDYTDMERFAEWVEQTIASFDLPANTLNLVFDGGGLSDNTRLSQRVLKAFHHLPVDLGISGFEPYSLIAGTETEAMSDLTLGYELLGELPLDFVLLDMELFADPDPRSAKNDVANASLQRLLQRCRDVSVTALLEHSPIVGQRKASPVENSLAGSTTQQGETEAGNSSIGKPESLELARSIRRNNTIDTSEQLLDLTVALP